MTRDTVFRDRINIALNTSKVKTMLTKMDTQLRQENILNKNKQMRT